jgi:hypothetical protein
LISTLGGESSSSSSPSLSPSASSFLFSVAGLMLEIKKIITGFVVVIRKTVLQLNYYLEKPNEKAGAAVVVAAGLLPEEKANNPPLEGGLVVELVLDALNENVDGVFVSDSILAEAPKEKVVADEEVVAGVELANENVEGGLAGVDPLPK